jgi:hypothetical protein
MDEQRVDGTLLFPRLGVGIEAALEPGSAVGRDRRATSPARRRHGEQLRRQPHVRPGRQARCFEAFNRWLEDDWGYRYDGRIFAVPYIALVEPAAAAAELRRVIDAGAVAVNIRAAPVAVPGGRRSPFDPAYDAIWALAAEAGVVVATHAGMTRRGDDRRDGRADRCDGRDEGRIAVGQEQRLDGPTEF